MECVDTLDPVLAHALAVGAGIEAEADDGPFGVRVGVFLVHFELGVQALDVPVDQVDQKLSALVRHRGTHQIGPARLDVLLIARVRPAIHVAQELIEGLGPGGIECVAGQKDLGDAAILEGVDGLTSQQPRGLEPIV